MRQWVAGVLIASVLFGQTELHQLFRLPVFVHHFLEHKAKAPGLTLGGFIIMHYFSGNVHDEDFAKDEQLPFRSHDAHPAMTVGCDLFPAFAGMFHFHRPVSALQPMPWSDAPVDGASAAIWQPPKRL